MNLNTVVAAEHIAAGNNLADCSSIETRLGFNKLHRRRSHVGSKLDGRESNDRRIAGLGEAHSIQAAASGSRRPDPSSAGRANWDFDVKSPTGTAPVGL